MDILICRDRIISSNKKTPCDRQRTESNADFTVRFDFLPQYPLLLKLWFADEEFPASGKLLLDTSADHYLMIEDAVTAGQIVMEKLVGVF